MDTLEAIYTRRSVRNYRAKDVAPETVKALLKAAMHAPSAADEQPWSFVVIDDRDLLDRIPALHPYAGMAAQAQVIVLVCGEPVREQHAGMWVQDCAAATQNLLLAAHAMGLGSVWVGVYPREERMRPLRQLLKIPDHIMPFALLPLGYPAETPAPREDPVNEDRIHTNRW